MASNEDIEYEEGFKGKFKQFKDTKPKLFKILVIVVILLLVAITIRIINTAGDASAGEDMVPTEELVQEEELVPLEVDEDTSYLGEGTDTMLLQMQEDLKSEFGNPPEGFIWDQQGNPLSRGIEGMSSEDTVYTYLRAVSTLDMGTVGKVTRDSSILQQMSEWSNSQNSFETDYTENFKRNMYQSVMQSLQIEGTKSSTVFADSKRSYTVSAKILDVSDKDFWQKDKDKIFEQLYKFDEVQSDSTQSEQYLQEYLMAYYQSGKSKMKNVSFTVTAEKFADINSAWLVSIDSDLDNLLKYQDGTSIDTYILEQYQYYKTDRVANGSGGE